MRKIRLISRVDVKNQYVIKSIHLEGLRKVGDPNELAKAYYCQGIDEVIFIDVVASLYSRRNIFEIMEKGCKDIFVPVVLAGGLKNTDDIYQALNSGADKIAINSQAIRTPKLINIAAKTFGSQCIVASIEAKKKTNGWEAYIDNGREETGKDAIEWAKEVESLGAGELLVTSIDCEGVQKGFDVALAEKVSSSVKIPVIISGGAGCEQDILEVTNNSNIQGVAIASILHYKKSSVPKIKEYLRTHGIDVRNTL